MVTIRSVERTQWRLVRSLRLAALADAPHAFSATLADEEAMPEELWRRRTEANATGTDSTLSLAFDGERPIGMAVGVLEAHDPTAAHLFAMWVAPERRGAGIGARLVGAIADRARGAGRCWLLCDVERGNERARSFYCRLGFVACGTGPACDLTAIAMRLSLDA